MTTDILTHTTAARPAGVLQRLRGSPPVAWAGRVLAAWQRRRRIAQTVELLSALDDRTLDDIGVPRGSIRDHAIRVEDGEAVR